MGTLDRPPARAVSARSGSTRRRSARSGPEWTGDYLFLFENLVLKDFKIRYRNMSLGVLWSLVNPLVMMLVLVFVFGGVVGGAHQPSFSVFVLCGLVPYNFFQGAFQSGTTSIVDSASLVKRVPVPREVVPVAAVLSNCIHMLIQIALLVAIAFAAGIRPGKSWIWMPLIWAIYVVFVCGISIATSAINVFVRDTRYVVESFNLVLFWLVPIFYSFSIIPKKYAHIYQFNPVAALVMAMRNIVLDRHPPAMSLVENLAIAAAVSLGAGLFIFGRLKPYFYEHI